MVNKSEDILSDTAQYIFTKKSSPFEKVTFDLPFEIEVEKIDCLYHLAIVDSRAEGRCELYCRVNYNDVLYYVGLIGFKNNYGCEFCWGFNLWDCQLCTLGYIYFCQDPSFFFDHIVCRNSIDHKDVVNKIYSALLSEDCQISPPELMLYHVHPTNRTNIPSLSHLLHECIYKNQNVLSLQDLPIPLSNSINNFTLLQKWLQDADSFYIPNKKI